jgi:hypothetical protein
VSSSDNPIFNSDAYLYGAPDLSPEHAAIQGMFLGQNFIERMQFAKKYFEVATLPILSYERKFGPYIAPPPDAVGESPAQAAAILIGQEAAIRYARLWGNPFKAGASDDDTDARFEAYGFNVLWLDGTQAATVRGSMGDEYHAVLRQIQSTWKRLLKSHPNREELATCSDNLWVVIGEYTGQGLPLGQVKHIFHKSGVTLLTLADISTHPFLKETLV